MNIKVLGPGCTNCKTLEHRTREAVDGLHLDATVEKVEDYQQIASYGIMRTPGLVIDENVVLSGSVPKVEDLKKILLQHGAVPRV
jgi:small redox-active disulfide protein 2